MHNIVQINNDITQLEKEQSTYKDYWPMIRDYLGNPVHLQELQNILEGQKSIKVKYHTEFTENYKPIEKIDQGDWCDLRSAETIVLNKGESYTLSLGVSMQLPSGYEAHIATRSSTFKTWGIIMTNSHGIIDESYCGDNDIWKMPIMATRDTRINKGDRVCQFRVVKKQPELVFETVENLGNPDRGGIGSTGKI